MNLPSFYPAQKPDYKTKHSTPLVFAKDTCLPRNVSEEEGESLLKLEIDNNLIIQMVDKINS